MKKRLLSTMLALCLMLTMLPLNALATDESSAEETETEMQADEVAAPEDSASITSTEVITKETSESASLSDEQSTSGTCGENVTWNLENGTLTIRGTGPIMENNPSYQFVPWYTFHDDIKTIIISDGVTEIGDDAFYRCTNLNNITIPNSVTKIAGSVFYKCWSLSNITIPVNVTEIGYAAFQDCKSLSNITIPNGVIKIGNHAFDGCEKLSNIIIPSNVSEIGESTFNNCNGLENIEVDVKNSVYDSRDNCNAIIKTASNVLVAGCKNTKIPASITEIGDCAFYGCTSLNSIVIPSNVRGIGTLAFNDCTSLNSIVIPSGVTEIGYGVFYGCSNLNSVIIPNSVTKIGSFAFDRCYSLNSIAIPSSVTEIEGSAFYFSGLTDIYYSGSEDDWNAISKGEGINEFLENNNVTIHYNSAGSSEESKPVTPGGNNSSTSKEYKIYRNGGYEVFDISLEDCIKRTDIIDANGYNPQLAHMLISMCCSVYSETDMKRTFASFGFDGIADNSRDGIFLGYGLAKKQLSNGKILVLVVTRGTPDFPDIEWGSNILPQFNITTGQHKGFSDAANGLYDRIGTQLGVTNFADVEFVITGFSRGAAAANILAGRLVDEHVPQSMIHAYTFACPDVGVMSENKAESYHCIFNIANANDIVSWVPKSIAPLANFGVAIINQILGLNWNKFGRSYWYT